VATIAALRGEDISWLPDAVEEALAAPLPEFGEQERFLVAGAGGAFPTAHEAVLKLREGAWVAAEAYETEQLLHGYFAAIDESVRAFVLEGEGLAAERAAAAAAGLRELGCDVDLVPTRHPVVDIVRFQRLTVEIAESRGREPDKIRRHDPRWIAAASAAKADNAA
jgi:glucosamine--fructose-6-phosphate aminotransferase (isomerizing)